MSLVSQNAANLADSDHRYQIYVYDDEGNEAPFAVIDANSFGRAVDMAEALGAKSICDAVILG